MRTELRKTHAKIAKPPGHGLIVKIDFSEQPGGGTAGVDEFGDRREVEFVWRIILPHRTSSTNRMTDGTGWLLRYEIFADFAKRSL